jgi:hypothetical protein
LHLKYFALVIRLGWHKLRKVTTVTFRGIVRNLQNMESGKQAPPAVDPIRTAVRFPLRLELLLETDEGELTAITEDVSANGVLFSVAKLPAVDSRVEFSMMMPAAIMGQENDVVVHCVGRIVRHDRSGHTLRAAAVIDEYFLRA